MLEGLFSSFPTLHACTGCMMLDMEMHIEVHKVVKDPAVLSVMSM